MTRIDEILGILKNRYKTREWDTDPFKVLISTILSQRTRDENTAVASKNLFSKYKNAGEMAMADEKNIARLIRASGFYNQKARRIKEVSGIIVNDYGGKVPNNMDELLKLPGVGRKTANCVLVYGYGKDAIPVDTHVHRISNRLGLVETNDPMKTEEELQMNIPRKYWIDLNELFVKFGKDICRPVKPRCDECPIRKLCSR